MVDMESHHVARLAPAHGLSFAAVRVVIDPAHRAVPEAALAGMLPSGGTSVTAVMRNDRAPVAIVRSDAHRDRRLCGAQRTASHPSVAGSRLRPPRPQRVLIDWEKTPEQIPSLHTSGKSDLYACGCGDISSTIDLRQEEKTVNIDS